MTTRGLRNCNPMNLRHSVDKWQGAADVQADTEFVTFKSPEFGIRAGAKVLMSYQKRGLDTVGEIISTFAPSTENDTNAYVQAVCNDCGVDSNDVLDMDNCETMTKLVKAIIKHENGVQPYSDAVILDGLRLAGIHDIAPTPIMKQPAGQAATVATIGGAVAGAGEIARQLKDAQESVQTGIDVLQWLASYGPGLAIALVIAGGIGVLYSLWYKGKRVGL